jgi:hypothetical protein
LIVTILRSDLIRDEVDRRAEAEMTDTGQLPGIATDPIVARQQV